MYDALLAAVTALAPADKFFELKAGTTPKPPRLQFGAAAGCTAGNVRVFAGENAPGDEVPLDKGVLGFLGAIGLYP